MKKRKIIIFSLVVIILGLVGCAYLSRQNLDEVRRVKGVDFVTLAKFNKFIADGDLSDVSYDVEKDILEAQMLNNARLKYNIGNSGVVYLGNVNSLIVEGKLSNTVVLNIVKATIKDYKNAPMKIGVLLILLVVFSLLLRPLENRLKTKDSNFVKGETSTIEFVSNEEISGASQIRLGDVKGHDELKDDLGFLIKMLKSPETFLKVGAKMPQGILLFGPPGTGKTMIAKAIANEAGVEFLAACGSDFIEQYVGVGAKRVRDLFEEAKKYDKCIVYIDEIDAIGKKRGGDGSNSERDTTLNALLTEMDGFEDSSNILVIASTNRLDVLDPALVRAGRFDKHIMVGLPDYKGRLEILKHYAKNKRLDETVKVSRIASITRGFSGAELANLLNEAAMLTAYRGKSVTSMKEIDDAHYKIMTKGDKRRNYDRTQHDTDITAWHEAGHAIISRLVAKQKVNKVTIVPSTSGAGGITFMDQQDSDYLSKEDLENMVKVCYGGVAAEEVLLKDKSKVTTGASNDIEKATNLIMNMISNYGMTDKFGLLNLGILGGNNEVNILEEANSIATKLYEETVSYLRDNYVLLSELSKRLVDKETVDEVELEELFDTYEKANNIRLVKFEPTKNFKDQENSVGV